MGGGIEMLSYARSISPIGLECLLRKSAPLGTGCPARIASFFLLRHGFVTKNVYGVTRLLMGNIGFSKCNQTRCASGKAAGCVVYAA